MIDAVRVNDVLNQTWSALPDWVLKATSENVLVCQQGNDLIYVRMRPGIVLPAYRDGVIVRDTDGTLKPYTRELFATTFDVVQESDHAPA